MLKKGWHIYCYINVIYITVFSVTATEKKNLNFLLLVEKVYQ